MAILDNRLTYLGKPNLIFPTTTLKSFLYIEADTYIRFGHRISCLIRNFSIFYYKTEKRISGLCYNLDVLDFLCSP